MKLLLKVAAAIIFAILLVFALAWYSILELSHNNGFNRKFILRDVKPISISDKVEKIVTIAGTTKSSILFRTKQPGELLVYNNNLKLIDQIQLDLFHTPKIDSRLEYFVDTPHIYTFAGNGPAIFLNSFTGKKNPPFYLDYLFLRAKPISSCSFVVSMFENTNDTIRQVLVKIDSNNNKIAQTYINSDNPTGLSDDGQLHYDSHTHSLVYIYFVQNKLLCLDTNLNVKYSANTFKPWYSLQAKAQLAGSNDLSMNSPKRIINSQSCVNKGLLYTCSSLKADNEESRVFDNNSAIDIYNISDANYIGSFYIPNYKGEKMKAFKVAENHMIVLYKNYIASYPIDK